MHYQTKPQSCHCRPGQSQGRHCHQYSFYYLQVLFNEELHQVALGQVQLSKEQYVRISRLADLGKASPAELAEAKARVAQDEMNVVQTNNNYKLACSTLASLSNWQHRKGSIWNLRQSIWI